MASSRIPVCIHPAVTSTAVPPVPCTDGTFGGAVRKLSIILTSSLGKMHQPLCKRLGPVAPHALVLTGFLFSLRMPARLEKHLKMCSFEQALGSRTMLLLRGPPRSGVFPLRLKHVQVGGAQTLRGPARALEVKRSRGQVGRSSADIPPLSRN